MEKYQEIKRQIYVFRFLNKKKIQLIAKMYQNIENRKFYFLTFASTAKHQWKWFVNCCFYILPRLLYINLSQ